MRTAYLGLGSNVGDRLATLQRAVDGLHATEGLAILRSSRIYETEPVGGPPQPRYLNAVLEARTSLGARELLDACRRVERSLGRERLVRWGPRTIDIDILTYGEERIDDPDLVIPHPRMHQRAFVLAPLLELDADPPLPAGVRLASSRLGPEQLSGIRVAAPPLLTSSREPP
jgi:2-amino-4-hydroxy-6-hydroxymethyldihydropteridine diphosphokinase